LKLFNDNVYASHAGLVFDFFDQPVVAPIAQQELVSFSNFFFIGLVDQK